jgi:anti-sigma regulatory factor (Ser/Thr protein kinase)
MRLQPTCLPPCDGEFHFNGQLLGEVRSFTLAHALSAGMNTRASDVVLAVSELAANSVRHAGGTGTLRIWSRPDGVLCEVYDAGCIDDSLAGRRPPTGDPDCGRGLWIVNNVCDAVWIRSTGAGNVVRVQLLR